MEKTWPAMTAELMQEQSALLRTKVNEIISDLTRSKQSIDMFIAGVRCHTTLERSAKMLLYALDKEQEELLALCNKYNKLSLDREAIVKTKLFKKIVRQADTTRDLFFFETFSDDGSVEVFGDVQSLENSSFTKGISRLIEEISSYEVPSDFNKASIQKRINGLISEAKDILWKRRSDVGLTYQKRIPIQLLDPPDRTKERIVSWKECGFVQKVIAHRNSFTVTLPDFCVQSLKKCFSDKQKQWGKQFQHETLDKLNFPQEYRSREFNFDRVFFGMMNLLHAMQPNPLHRDPIIYCEDGDWTVVIDQYAKFPKEKEIVRTVKEHYRLLADHYGILRQVN